MPRRIGGDVERKESGMIGKMMTFGAGAAIGYVLGTRAGRERFDEISHQAKRVWESDTVQEAAAGVQVKAEQLLNEGRKMGAGQTTA
jgi:hypothetical protein